MDTGPKFEFRKGREVMPGTDIPVGVPVDGGTLIADVERLVTRYAILPSAAPLPVALWAIATHAFDLFDAFPYLSLSSPTPRCGKTRLLEILELLVARPWRGTAPTEAALFRFIEENQPTLLLDEVEGLAKRHASERDSAVLAILNAGYKKGQTVPRCVGNSHTLQNFRVYCPKAFAAIGGLPATLADRSIVIPMQRRSPNEPVARFRFERVKCQIEPLLAAIQGAIKMLAGEIRQTYAELPELPDMSDRDEEIFSPLFAVCAVLAPGRVGELRTCAKALSDAKGSDAIDDSLALRLLADLVRLWPEGAAHWPTADVLGSLKTEPESPWANEVELNARKLARMLKPFLILPRDLRTDAGSRKGYVFEDVRKAHSRYIAQESATRATDRMNTGED